MAGKAAAMTPTEIQESGFSVFEWADIGNKQHAEKPWVIQGRSGSPWSGRMVLARYATYGEAVEDLHLELTDPDGTLNTGHMSRPAKSPTIFDVDDTMEIDRVVYGGPGD